MQKLAVQQRQRAADAAVIEAQRKEEIKQRIADHEKRHAAKLQHIEEKERLRKERERILAEKRISAEQKEAQVTRLFCSSMIMLFHE